MTEPEMGEMRKAEYPTGQVLVGCLLICAFSVPGLSDVDNWGVLKTGEDAVYFPWSDSQSLTMPMARYFPGQSSQSEREQIQLNSSNSAAEVDDLMAVNCQKERELHFNRSDPQSGDMEYGGLANALAVSVQGDDDIHEIEFPQNEIRHAGNYLNVQVSDITVTAINTMEGGTAAATSNIIIEPVQIILCPSEVAVKLK